MDLIKGLLRKRGMMRNLETRRFTHDKKVAWKPEKHPAGGLCPIIIVMLMLAVFMLTSCEKNNRLFVGGFTRLEGEKGLTLFDFNSRTGKLEFISSFDVGPSPSFFCFSRKNRIIYVLNEVMEFKGQFGGGLSTFRYSNDEPGLEKLNEMLIPYGGPCYISMSADSGYLFIANYPNGSVAVVKLDEAGIPEKITDTILYVREEPDRSHAHMILHDPAGKYVYVSDLGLDRLVVYEFDNNHGKLNQVENGIANLPKRSGPRHFVFNESGSMLYVINELGSTTSVFRVERNGSLRLMQNLTTRSNEKIENNYCGDIHLDKKNLFLYGSNRGENTIVTYRVGDDGLIDVVGHSSCGGDWPRNFVIAPSGRFIITGNQKSDEMSVFRINKRTGLLSSVMDTARVRMPACIIFSPFGD